MKKSIFAIVIFLFAVFRAEATGVSDIPNIFDISDKLMVKAIKFHEFAQKLVDYKNSGFIVPVDGSTQTFALSNSQQLGLVAEYQNQKAAMAADFNQLP